MKKLVKESLSEENQSMFTTVDKLLTWYMNDEYWRDDWNTTNVMLVDGTHAQEDGEDGDITLAWLDDHKNDRINVISTEDDQGTYDLEFEVDGKSVSIQSTTYAFGEIN